MKVMPRLAPTPVQLSEAERTALEQIVSRHLTPQQMAMRARIILLAEQGSNHREIARALNITRDTARYWRRRWLESAQSGKSVAERLQDARAQWSSCNLYHGASPAFVCFGLCATRGLPKTHQPLDIKGIS